MRNNIASYPHIFMKLNQSQLYTTQSPSSSPNNNNNENLFNKILMQLIEWLAFFPNLINSLIVKFKDTFTNFFATLSHWLAFFPNLINSVVAKCKDTFTNFFQTLSHWLSFLPNLINSLITQCKDTFNNSLETLGHWLPVAAPYLIAGAGIVALCTVLFFCLPAIIGCFAWLAATCWAVISSVFLLLRATFAGLFTMLWTICRSLFMLLRSLFMLLWRMCGSLFGMCCLCGGNSLKMMIAPGTAGTVLIARAVFESNPAAYFSNLRAGLV